MLRIAGPSGTLVSMSERIGFFDQAAFEQLRRARRLDPLVVRRLRTALCKRFDTDQTALAEFPAGEAVAVHSLELFRRSDSELDGASKLLLRTSGGMLIEAVILRLSTGRTTLCVSSQVGCAAACDFCATGKMGIARNLTTAEILDQVLTAGQMLAVEQRSLRNVVFMGMGEPYHNESQVFEAIETLISPTFFALSPAKILVSTVGVVDGMLRCAERFPKVHQALSLHSVRQDVRERLIPLAKKFPLARLREAIETLNRRYGQTVMIEYLLLAGVNDSEEDAREVVAWMAGLDVHVNLIPYNRIEEAPHLSGSLPETRTAFARILKDSGLKTTTRYSLGNDIAAACGQLVRHENRIQAMQGTGS